MSDLTSPNKDWTARNFDHIGEVGRWYVPELIEMARNAVANALPKIQSMALSGQKIELFAHFHQTHGSLNWGDAILLSKDEPAPEGFVRHGDKPIITGATPYGSMISVLLEECLLKAPVLPSLPCPYVPMADRGNNEIIAMMYDREGLPMTVSFREGGSKYLCKDVEGNMRVLTSDPRDGYVVQQNGTAQLSSGRESFWYEATAQGHNDAIEMMKVLSDNQSQSPAIK